MNDMATRNAYVFWEQAMDEWQEHEQQMCKIGAQISAYNARLLSVKKGAISDRNIS